MMSCEYFKCSKYADREHCWCSGLDTATYCSVGRITHACCTTPSGSFVVVEGARDVDQSMHTYLVQRCMLRIDTVTALITAHPPRIRSTWRAVNYNCSMDRHCSASFLHTFRCTTTWLLYDNRVTRSSMHCTASFSYVFHRATAWLLHVNRIVKLCCI